jgi:hypothetical protein
MACSAALKVSPCTLQTPYNWGGMNGDSTV